MEGQQYVGAQRTLSKAGTIVQISQGDTRLALALLNGEKYLFITSTLKGCDSVIHSMNELRLILQVNMAGTYMETAG